MKLSKQSCKNCGAELSFNPTEQKVTCDFCNSSFEISRETASASSSPRFIIPFKTDESTFLRAAFGHLCLGDYTPVRLISQAELRNITQVYVPVIVFAGEYEGDWSAMIGHYADQEYYTRDSNGELVKDYKIRTDWSAGSGRVKQPFFVLRYAGADDQFDDELQEFLTQISIDRGEAEAFQIEFTAGINVLPFEKDFDDLWNQEVRDYLDDQCRNEVIKSLPGDEYEDLRVSVGFNDRKEFLIHLPIWHATYHFEQKEYRVVMSGEDSELVSGKRPVDEKLEESASKAVGFAHIILIAAIVFLIFQVGNNRGPQFVDHVLPWVMISLIVVGATYIFAFKKKKGLIEKAQMARQAALRKRFPDWIE